MILIKSFSPILIEKYENQGLISSLSLTYSYTTNYLISDIKDKVHNN